MRRFALAQRIEGRRVGKQRIPPSEQHVGPITVGDMVRAIDTGGDLGKGEAIRLVYGIGGAPSEQRRSEQCRGGCHPERAAHHLAAAVAPQDDVADGVGFALG